MRYFQTAALVVPITSVFAGQCTTAESSLWIDKMEFTTVLTNCAVKFMGGDQATSNCLKGAYNGQLSDSCAMCFGQTVKCGVMNCAGFCADDAGDAACLSCTKEKGCDDGLNTCTGFSQGPPKPLPLNQGNRGDDTNTTTTTGKAFEKVVGVTSITISLIGLALSTSGVF